MQGSCVGVSMVIVTLAFCSGLPEFTYLLIGVIEMDLPKIDLKLNGKQLLHVIKLCRKDLTEEDSRSVVLSLLSTARSIDYMGSMPELNGLELAILRNNKYSIANMTKLMELKRQNES